MDQPGGKDTLDTLSDALLAQRFLEGDQTSFDALFVRHYDLVYGVLYRLTGERQQAEDLAQDVFLQLYRKPLRDTRNVAGWLYRTATNMGYNALRAERRRLRRERASAPHARDVTSDPSEEAERRAEVERVRSALACIAPRAAKLLVLREMGLSYRELAEAIGVAPGSVGTLLARAADAFRAAYEGEEKE
jgi:RNA polymerase sigma-70 factor (ECF subfamily)